MSNLNQFAGGNRSPSAIINRYSSGGTATSAGALGGAGKVILSGALTANTLATSLSVTGAGVLRYVAVGSVDTTARTIRGKLTIDGVSVFDATSSSVTTTDDGIVIVGGVLVNAFGLGFIQGAVYFQNSFLLEIASSLPETNKISGRFVYEVY